MQDNKNEKKKLSLTVRNVETLELRASPNTVCPDKENYAGACCRGSTQPLFAAKLTAVAYF